MIFTALANLTPSSLASSKSIAGSSSRGFGMGLNMSASAVKANANANVNLTNNPNPLVTLDAKTQGLVESDIHAVVH
ncbi:hypothetical protein CYY_005455 [Polysphondylium violaceum]|uniref:Uncharacterized protein n=1 Tax=Polysphondylium violaceum TaxID=133409 RepID=A0A8J4UZK8_9MYCE|nr:hypothetical protein CYY_005455 [Polysphondylium violaceum]